MTQYVINIWTQMISCRISASDIVNGRAILVISTGQSCFLNFHILAEFVFIAFLVENFFEAIDYKIFNSNLKKQDNCLDNINGISKQLMLTWVKYARKQFTTISTISKARAFGAIFLTTY